MLLSISKQSHPQYIATDCELQSIRMTLPFGVLTSYLLQGPRVDSSDKSVERTKFQHAATQRFAGRLREWNWSLHNFITTVLSFYID